MGNSLAYEEYLRQRSLLEKHPAFQDEPGRRVFTVIDGEGQDTSRARLVELRVVR